jgi:iron complex transport system ATP-binding protein
MSVLVAKELTIGYRKRVVAERLSLGLRAGELVCLLGPNGAGKSTLIRTLAGMQPPLAGRVSIQGDDVGRLPARELAKRLSVVLTERMEVGVITARALVALGRYPYTDWMSRQTDTDRCAVQWALDAVDALSLAERSVHELSDGERQKIMIARALAQEPAVMILDEPTAFLDLPRRVEIVHLLRTLARDTGRAILLSTHDLDLALRSADQVWLMGLGRPIQMGAPEDLVLSGAFEQVFASSGVSFDVESGAFSAETPYAGSVEVLGRGAAALWTKRALQREGFLIASSSADTVEVMMHDGELRWRTRMGGAAATHDSIYALLAFVKSHPQETEPIYER